MAIQIPSINDTTGAAPAQAVAPVAAPPAHSFKNVEELAVAVAGQQVIIAELQQRHLQMTAALSQIAQHLMNHVQGINTLSARLNAAGIAALVTPGAPAPAVPAPVQTAPAPAPAPVPAASTPLFTPEVQTAPSAPPVPSAVASTSSTAASAPPASAAALASPAVDLGPKQKELTVALREYVGKTSKEQGIQLLQQLSGAASITRVPAEKIQAAIDGVRAKLMVP